MSKWIAALLLLVSATGRAADGSNTTPYSALYAVLAPTEAIRAYDRLVPVERVESQAEGVRPGDIRITIHAKSGAIAVPVSADGSIEFPATQALLAENPPVETNQPKGSLALIVRVGLRVPATLDVPWSDLAAALQQADELFAKTSSGSGGHVRGIEIQFDKGAPASLTVSGKTERLLTADESGSILLMRDSMVESEHPRLLFSRRPARLLAYLE